MEALVGIGLLIGSVVLGPLGSLGLSVADSLGIGGGDAPDTDSLKGVLSSDNLGAM